MLVYSYLYQLLIVAAFAVIIVRMIMKKKDKMKIFAACVLMVYTVEAVGIFFFPVFYDARIRKFSPPDINFIPFHSIAEYCQHFSADNAVKQIFGNVLAFFRLVCCFPSCSKSCVPGKTFCSVPSFFLSGLKPFSLQSL